MAEFTVSEVCSATNGQISNNTDCRQFTGVCTDTRRIKPGNLFVALAGERFDGHEFVEQAITQSLAQLTQSEHLREALKGMRVNVSITFEEV